MLVQSQETAGTCGWAQVANGLEHLYTATTLDMAAWTAGGALLWGDDPVSSIISKDLKATAQLSFSCTLCESSPECKSFCTHYGGMSCQSGGLLDWKRFLINASPTELCFPEKIQLRCHPLVNIISSWTLMVASPNSPETAVVHFFATS